MSSRTDGAGHLDARHALVIGQVAQQVDGHPADAADHEDHQQHVDARQQGAQAHLAGSRRPGPGAIGQQFPPVRHRFQVSGCPAGLPLDHALYDERDYGEQREQGGHGKCSDERILVVEDFDMQGHCRRQAPDVPGHDRDGPELAHGPGVAEDHAVDQSPADLWQGDPDEGHQPAGAEGDGGFLLVVAQLFHQRDQLPGDVGEGHEEGREDDAGQGEDHVDVVVLQPEAEPALRPEQQHVHQARDDGGYGKRQVDQRDQEGLAAELELGDGPGGADAEDGVQGHHDGGRQ